MAEPETKSLVPDTKFDNVWLESVLQKSLKTNAKLTSTTTKRLGESQGHLSYVMKVRLTWEPLDDHTLLLPSSVVLKAPTNSVLEEIEKDLEEKTLDHDFAFEFHNTESGFYSLWQKAECPWRVPRCFHTHAVGPDKKDGILVFEDMSDIAYVPEVLAGLNLKQALEVAREIGKKDAWFIQNQDKLRHFSPPRKAIVHTWSSFFANSLERAVKVWPAAFEGVDVEKFLKEARKPENMTYVYYNIEQVDVPKVLAHGDLWASNMFFYKDRPDEIAAIIDWQLLHPSVPGEDLSRMLRFSVEEKVWRDHTGDILSGYYDTLLGCLGGTAPFSFEDLLQCYEWCRVQGLIFGVGCLALICLEYHDGDDEEKKQHIPKALQRTCALIADFSRQESSNSHKPL